MQESSILDVAIRQKIRSATWAGLVAMYCVAFVAGIFAVTARPSAGVTLEWEQSRLIISEMEPGSQVWLEDGRVGDEIVSINGEPASSFSGDESTIDTLTVLNESWSEPRRVSIVRSPTSLIDEAFSLNLLGVVFAVMSVFIFFRAQRKTDTIMFALMAMASAVSLAIGPSSIANHPWGRLFMGASLYVNSILFLAFFIGFPRGATSESSKLSRWLPEIAIGLSAISIIPWVLTAAGIVDLWEILRPGMLVFLALGILGGVGILGMRLRSASRENNEQLRIVTLGTLIGLVPFIWLSVIPMLITGEEIVLGEVAVLGFVLLPLSFGYAIMRHSLMGIRRLFHRTAAYALITAAIIIIYGSVLTIASLFNPESSVLRPLQISLLVALFAVAPMLSVVRRKAMAFVDRVLYQGAMEPQDLVRAVSAQAATANDRERMLSRSLQLIGDGMELDFIGLITHREEGNSIDHSHGELDTDTTEGLRSLRRPGESRVRTSMLPATEQNVLLAPLHGLGGAGTTLVLGTKTSEETFTEEDTRLVQTVSGVLSTAIARLQLLSEVEAQSKQLESMGTELQTIQEEEREEISAYLHDEPLQKVAYALAQMRERALPDDLAGVLEEVAKDLRNTSASLSPEMLRDNGLVVAVDWMVEEQRRRGPFEVFLDIEGLAEKELIDDDIQLAAYRVIQEALNNARKHAKAKAVWIRIDRTRSQLEVAVEDNGVGIDSTMVDRDRPPEEGLGLRGLRQRISGLNGTMTILPRASRGTAVRAKIPLPSSTAKAAG